ncbi:hypothetical protein [Mycobacterium sp.]|uniref:hypothetical protein n=1 Tax=Mycobacterium sp. TaxID=1785 RepID=UPI0031E3242B
MGSAPRGRVAIAVWSLWVPLPGRLWTFGLTPPATVPPAHADELHLILDPIINSFSSVDPALGADLSGLVSSFDPTHGADSVAAAPTYRQPLQQARVQLCV